MTHPLQSFLTRAVLVLGLALSLSTLPGVRAQAPAPKLPSAQEAVAKAAANATAEAWLMINDVGRSADSWEAAASYFKRAVTKDRWQAALTDERAKLGDVVKREFQGAVFTKQLPGAPAGEYVVIQNKTAFAKRPSTVETITVVHEDGGWKVAGYYIK